MAQSKTVYEGLIASVPHYDIVLNVQHLEKGIYTLKIIHKNKVIKQTTFKK